MFKIKFAIIAMLLMISSFSYAVDSLKPLTGYTLLHNLNLDVFNNQNATFDEISNTLSSIRYIQGVLDGIQVYQTGVIRNNTKMLTDNEYSKMINEIGIYQIDIPEKGLHVGQLILVYKNWAKTHPKDLHMRAMICIFLSLRDTFGLKGQKKRTMQ